MSKDRKKSPANKKTEKLKVSSGSETTAVAKKISNEKRELESRLMIVGIGASAGGLESLIEIFRNLPPQTGLAFVIVQHLSPEPASRLTHIIQEHTKMLVTEIVDGTRVLPNAVYVIPPSFNLEIHSGVMHLQPRVLPRSTNRAIDTFFKSLAADSRNLAVGVVLSGTGTDGADGLISIKAAGGISVVQEPATAKFDGMPNAAINADHPDYVLKPEDIARELVKIASSPHFKKTTSEDGTALTPEDERALQKVFVILRAHTGTDFSVYKYPTIIRRMKRRMMLHGLDSVKKYFHFLENSPPEIKLLFKDLLINVTQFFRDPGAFKALTTEVFPAIIKNRPMGSVIRVWVPGCSTGEEVYSIAISFLEFLGERSSKYPIQIYGTDISEATIKKARAGIYTNAIEGQVSEKRLERFFSKEGQDYRIASSVRECCIFSVQNVAADPPIHRLDLLSCRNLMIYLGAPIQSQLMEAFFYALNPHGFLLLGTSESVGAAASLFSVVNDKYRIFSKRANAAPSPSTSSSMVQRSSSLTTEKLPGQPPTPVVPNLVSVTNDIVLEKYAPAWILVTSSGDIIHFKGRTENFISPRSGQPSWNLMKMLREDLVTDVRVLIQFARTEGKATRKNNLKFIKGPETYLLDIEVVPVEAPQIEKHFLVLFFERVALKPVQKIKTKKNAELIEMSEELSATQKSLRSFLDDQSSINEELQSANEEILSANEELQSTNEELETAREELQSTNQELQTLNEELSNRNVELKQVNNDLTNLLSAAQIAIVMVGPDLQIKRMTPAGGQLLGLTQSDIGRKLEDFSLGFSLEPLAENIAKVVGALATVNIEIANRAGHFYKIQMRPYVTADNKIDGAVMTFTDSDVGKNKEIKAREAQRYSDAIIETVHDPIIVLNQDFKVERVNLAFCETFKVELVETIGKYLYELGNGQWNIADLRKLLEEVLPSNSSIKNFKVTHNFETIGRKVMFINAQKLDWREQSSLRILLSIREEPSSQQTGAGL